MPPSMSVNVGKSDVFSEARALSTTNTTGARTVPLEASKNKTGRLTSCMVVACDFANLLLSFDFKGRQNGEVEMGLNNSLPSNIFCCWQENNWMEKRSMLSWTEKVWKLYISGYRQSVFQSEDLMYTKSASTVGAIKAVRATVKIIIGGYTSIFQPCNVDFMCSTLFYIRLHWSNQASTKFQNLTCSAILSIPDQINIVDRTSQVQREIDTESIRNTFSHIVFEVLKSSSSTLYFSTSFLYVHKSGVDGEEVVVSGKIFQRWFTLI